MKHRRTSPVLGKDAVQHECVDVHVQIERPAEPLENGHRTPTTFGHIVQLCTTTQPPQHRTHVDGDDGAAQVMVPRQAIAQAIRQTQDPLPYRDIREDVVHQVRRAFSHSTTSATWTEPPSFTREGHQPIQAARGTPKAGEAASQ